MRRRSTASSRNDPNADTHDYRYGVSFGGPIVTNRTFFFGNYEGSRLKAARRRRAGRRADGRHARRRFLGRSFIVVRDPLTGAASSRATAFPPSGSTRRRAASSTSSIRCRTRRRPPTAASARFAQILPLERTRDRADARIDHELTRNDSLFARMSWQRRDPDAFTFESTGGNGGTGLTNLGLLDRAIEGDHAGRPAGPASGRAQSSTSSAAATASTSATAGAGSSPATFGSAVGIEVPPLAAEAPGFPQFLFSGAQPPVRHPRPAAEHLPRPAISHRSR